MSELSDVHVPFGSREGTINAGKVTAAKIATGAVEAAKIATGAVTMEKLNTESALEGQVLEADGAGGAKASEVKEYLALLTQNGTSAPVAIVLKNTLGGNIVWTRDDEGIYLGALASAFPLGRTVLSLGAGYFPNGYDEDMISLRINQETENEVRVLSGSYLTASYLDGVITYCPIHIEVYPA